MSEKLKITAFSDLITPGLQNNINNISRENIFRERCLDENA